MSFCVWLISHSKMSSRSIHVFENGKLFLFFMAEYYSIVYIYHFFFIHFSFDVHLGCFHILAIMNNEHRGADISLRYWFHFLWICTWKWDCWVIWYFYFSFLRNLHTVFYHAHTNWHSLYTNSVQGFLFLLHPHQHLLSFVFLIIAILTDVRWYLVASICLSLMISDEHLFPYFWSFVCLPLRNVPSDPLLVFILSYLGFFFFFAINLYEFLIHFG